MFINNLSHSRRLFTNPSWIRKHGLDIETQPDRKKTKKDMTGFPFLRSAMPPFRKGG